MSLPDPIGVGAAASWGGGGADRVSRARATNPFAERHYGSDAPRARIAPAGPARQATAATAAPPARRPRSTGKLKAVLVLCMLVGAVSSFGGLGSFASFSAETTNPGSGIASGTLTMSNTVNGGTACLSYGAGSANNVNPACSTMITLTNAAPGVPSASQTAIVTVKNTGSIDASKLWLWSPSVNTTLTTGLSNGVSSGTTLSVAALPTAIVSGQAVVVRSGLNSQTFSVTANAAQGATAISVTAQNANATYAAGSTVQVVDCYDRQTASAPPGAPAGSTFGNLTFNPTTGNPMCGAALLYIQEITGTVAGTPGSKNYCWFGLAFTGGSSGMCAAPVSTALSSSISGTINALPVVSTYGINGNIKSGDKIVVASSGGASQTFTASADVYVGATSIPLPPNTAVSGTFAAGSTVAAAPQTTDSGGALAQLNNTPTQTISAFDTLHYSLGGPIQMPPVTSNGTTDAATVTELPAGSSRTFLVGVYLPAPVGSNQNFLQALQSAFGLSWHIEQ